jgi:hypothetical protein
VWGHRTAQNFARKHRIAIDLLNFDFVLLPHVLGEQLQRPVALLPPPLSVAAAALAAGYAPPAEGVVVHGLFLEGAAWDWARGTLGESAPKVGTYACSRASVSQGISACGCTC